jgi:V/A-type H+-transporting ATPase subunit C
MRRHSVLEYIFATGKIRALEKFLFRAEVFEEAMNLSLAETLRLFTESALVSDEILNVKDSSQLESILARESFDLKNAISALIMDENLLTLLELNDLNQMRDAAGACGSEFLSDYVAHMIDMHNIKTFMRFYVLKEPEERLGKNLIKGGFFDNAKLLELYKQNLEALLTRLEYVHKRSSIIDYASYLSEAIKDAALNFSFIRLEKAIDDLLMDILIQAKRIIFGPEPVVAYYFARLNEINLIRMVVISKLNDVSKNIVSERLNNVYA